MTIVKWNRGRQNGVQSPALIDRDFMLPSLFNRSFVPGDFFRDFFNDTLNTGVVGRNLPAVNISETENDLVIEVAAPGMKKQDFKIEIDGDQMHVSYKKEDKVENNEASHWRREFSF